MAGEDKFWLNDPVVEPTQGGANWWEADEITTPTPQLTPKTAPAGQSSLSPEVLSRIESAKAGTLEVSPEGAARQAEIDAAASPEDPGIWQGIKDNFWGGLSAYGEGVGRPAVEAFTGVPGDDRTAFGAMASNFGQGVSFRYADEIAARLGSWLGDGEYDEILGNLQRYDNQLREDFPVASTVGEIAGAVASPVNKLFIPSKGANLATTAGKAAGWGGLAGGLYGFGAGEGGFYNRLGSGLVGAVGGAAVGGAIPLVAEAAKAGWRGLQGMRRNAGISAEIGNALGVSPQAGRVVGDAVSIDNPAALTNALAPADTMLADASPEMAMYLRGAMRTPNPGSRLAMDRVEARAAGAYDDLLGAINPAGRGPGVGEAMDAIRTGSAGARSTAYDAAYAAPIDYASDLGAKLLDDISPRLPAKAVSYANELMRLKGEKSAQIMASIADDGMVAFTRPPDVRQWDYIKQALDQLAESGEGAGALGGQTRLGAAYQGLAREVRDVVADLVPEYRTALDTASDAIGRRNAVQFGADMLSPRVTTEEALGTISGATVAEREAMKTGFRGQLDEVLGNVRAAASDQNIDARQAMTAFKALSSPNAQKKLEALFGSEWQGIKAQFDKAGRALGLRANTSANSATAANLFFDRTVQEAVQPGALRSGKPMEAVRNFLGGITGASPEAVNRLSSEVKAELADLLTRGNAQQSLGVILNALGARPANPSAGEGIYNALTAGGARSIPAIAGQLQNMLPR